MPAAHPRALRQRVIDAYDNGEGTYAEIAERFSVGVASVSRWLALERYTGNVEPKPAGGDRRPALSEAVRDNVLVLVNDEPNWSTTELSEQLEADLGVSVSRQRVARLLHKEGYSFKRGSSDPQPLGDPSTSQSALPSSRLNPGWTQDR